MAKAASKVFAEYTANLDLKNPTVRVRYFSGRSAGEVARDMPIIPLPTPALNGGKLPSTIVRAATLFDDMDTEAAKGAPYVPGAYFHAIVRSMLYCHGFCVNMPIDSSLNESVRICPGYYYGRNVYGPLPDTDIMVVGKCLGSYEDASGIPFSGNTSQTLWSVWDDVGLPSRSDVKTYATNVIKFQPPQAAMAKIPTSWLTDGAYILRHEILLARPKWILLLGADALKAVVGKGAKVSDYRGRVGEIEFNGKATPDDADDIFKVKFIVADHPAAVSRDPDLYPMFVNSLKLLREKAAEDLGLTSTAKEEIVKDYKAIYTMEELRAAVEETLKATEEPGSAIAIDCEWEGQHPLDEGAYLYTVQWSHGPGHARCLFINRQGGAVNFFLDPDETTALLNKLFREAPSRGTKLVGHFLSADLPWLKHLGVDLYSVFNAAEDDDNPDGIERFYGFQKQYVEGGHDTYIAQHAVEEGGDLKLELVCAAMFGIERWDVPVIKWKDKYLKDNKLKKSELKGYGNLGEEVCTEYGCSDVSNTYRLYLHQNGDPRLGTQGTLDKDGKGNNCRQIFWLRMSAFIVWAEMNDLGLLIDGNTQVEIAKILSDKRDALLNQLRKDVKWPEFQPSKRSHIIEFLFGEEFSSYGVRVSKPDSKLLYLKPFKATKTTGDDLWDAAVANADMHNLPKPVPATDSESILAMASANLDCKELITLKQINDLTTALRSTFRLPDEIDEETGEVEYDKGIMSHVRNDGCVHSTYGLAETGRCTSSRPNTQNFGGAVDERLNKILGYGKDDPNQIVTRSIVKAIDDWYVVNADLKGAEIAIAGWISGDPLLIEHARMNTLPEDDPDYLDLHSDLTQRAFKLDYHWREVKHKAKALRTASKRTRFGHYYGASPQTILRKVQEEAPTVKLEEIIALVRGHDEAYPTLAGTFQAARKRVTTPGWLCTAYGAYRRAKPTRDRELVAKQEREFQNFICQNPVADHISKSLANLRRERAVRQMRFQIRLSVHDSILLYVPREEVVEVVDVVFPKAMSKDAPFKPVTLDGAPINRGPYYFGIDIEVSKRWGLPMNEEEWRNRVTEPKRTTIHI